MLLRTLTRSGVTGTEILTAAYEVMLPAGSYRLRVRLVEAHTRVALTAWAARDFTVVHCRFALSGAALRRATVGQVKPTGRSCVRCCMGRVARRIPHVGCCPLHAALSVFSIGAHVCGHRKDRTVGSNWNC